jgi:hypothetical protein
MPGDHVLISSANRCSRGIEESQRRDSQAWGGSERMKILDLLRKTLKDLGTYKAALERSNP